MEDINSIILPQILDNLSRKPKLCDTYENLCNELEQVLCLGNVTGAKLRKAIKKSLDVGQNLGILTLNDEMIRMPFKYRTNNVTQTRRRRRVVPKMSPHTQSKRRTRSRAKRRVSRRLHGRRSGSRHHNSRRSRSTLK